MAESCIFIPTVKKKQSKLYKELLNKTANNRPLTNLCYAAAQHPSIKAKVSAKDLNSLGEIPLSILNNILDIDSMIPSQERINQFNKEIGAVDENGVKVRYNTPDEILDKVLEFNNNHDTYVANIVFKNDKFNIEISSITTSNYNANYYYKRNKARYDKINSYLANTLGFNTSGYSNNIISKFNFLNSQYVVNFITNHNGKGFRGIYDSTMVDLLKHWMYDNIYLERLYNTVNGATREEIDNKINSLLMYVSNPTYANPNLLDGIDNLDYVKQLAEGFLSNVNTKLNTIYSGSFIEMLQKEELAVENDKKVFNLPATDIKGILKDLYSRFHLDKDLQQTSVAQLKTLGDLTNRLLTSRMKALRLLKNNKELLKSESRKIKEYQADIKQAKYGESIFKMMVEINEMINSFVTDMNDKELPLNDFDRSDVKAFRDKAQYLNRIFSFLEENMDVIKACSDIHTLKENTGDDITDEALLDSICKAASTIQSQMNKLERYAIEERFQVVYDYLKIYWGNNDIKGDGNTNYSLESMLRAADRDVNLIYRFLLSMGQSKDAILGLVYESTLEAKRRMNEKFSKVEFLMNEATEALYSSGSDSKFCFEFDKEGVPTGRLLSNINWNKWKEDIQNYRKYLEESGKYTKERIDTLVEKWKRDNMEEVELFNGSIQFKEALKRTAEQLYGKDVSEKIYNRKFMLPKADAYGNNNLDKLSQVQRNYYYQMMAFKSILSREMPFNDINIFNAVQIAGTTLNQVEQAGGFMDFVKNKLRDVLEKREDDYDFGGDEFTDMLSANNIVQVESDVNNKLIQTVPILFSRKIKDKRRLSTNMSHAMNAWIAGAIQYEEMNAISDLLELTQGYLTDHVNGRKTNQIIGNKSLLDIFTFGKETYVNTINKTKGLNSDILLNDFYEKNVYGKHKKTSKTVSVFGVDVSLDKAADLMTRYTSFTGLAVNVMGAQANLLVGKLQMVIEAGAGEFFNLKDFAAAEAKYYQMLPELMNELNSNNKKSKLQLLGDYFDVTDDFLEKAREKGFNKDALSRILTNPNFLFMYGMGEHVLHFQTMLAVMNHIKVRNKKTGLSSTLLDVFSVKLGASKKNGELEINTDDYEIISKDKKGNEVYTQLTQEHINRVRKQIKHCNNTMHGAFGSIDRGTIHQFAFGRLIMNFRQWMPAHYARRFQGKHYDADLGEFRQGYYVSTWEFLKNVFTDKKLMFNLKACWNELSETDKFNVKRARTECILLVMLCAEIACLGTYKDKKGNWAYRNLMYQLRRMRMETTASVPFTVVPFMENILNIINSPMASISSFRKAASLLNITNLYKEVEGGKHKGENLWLHNAERNVPLYGQIKAQLIDFVDEDYLFNVFN